MSLLVRLSAATRSSHHRHRTSALLARRRTPPLPAATAAASTAGGGSSSSSPSVGAAAAAASCRNSTTGTRSSGGSSSADARPDGDGAAADASTVVRGPSLLTSTSVHRPSPSLFQLPGLRSLPFWTAPPDGSSGSGSGSGSYRVAYNDPTLSSVLSTLEGAYPAIKSEYANAVIGTGSETDPDSGRVQRPLEPDYDLNSKGGGGEHSSDALHTGTWDWHSYLLNGKVQPRFAERCPTTAGVVDQLRRDGTLFETPFAFCFFSTLQGRSTIRAHVGPMNLRLRIHLPLIVPSEEEEESKSKGGKRPSCGLRVGSQVRRWEEGRPLVLDDSYEHEVWNDTDSVRVLLLLDVWHPDVTEGERERIRNMFKYARDKGWIGKKEE